jgi:solute:Na+ symporter, SSS family
MHHMPIGVRIAVGIALAAAISSLDSDLNCLAAIVVEDYYARFKPNSSDKKRMQLSRITVIVAGMASVLIALYLR